MIFNKPLLRFCVVCLIACQLWSCSSTPAKPEAATASANSQDGAPASPENSTAEKVDATKKIVLPANILPAGPVTPNPYLQTTSKISEQINASFRDAVAAIQAKNWDHAEKVLKPIAEKNPQLSGVHLNLGIVYRGKGDNESAAAAFNRAITANAKNVDAYNQLAVLKREAGDFSAAESLYIKSLAVWPFFPEGHKNLAILYDLYFNKPEQALPHYQAYQQLLPAADKQVDSWVADLERRMNSGKNTDKSEAK